jgi:hypothetical protein
MNIHIETIDPTRNPHFDFLSLKQTLQKGLSDITSKDVIAILFTCENNNHSRKKLIPSRIVYSKCLEFINFHVQHLNTCKLYELV